MSDFEICKEEVEGSMDEISCEEVAVFEVGDEFDHKTVPMWVYVEWIHAEIDDIDNVLLVLVVTCLSLFLVILEDDCIGLLEGIIIVKQSFNQLIDAKLFNKCKFFKLTSREEPILESSQITQDNLNKKRDDTTVLQGNWGVEDSSLDVEVSKAGNDEVIQPFDLPDPVYVKCLDGFVEN